MDGGTVGIWLASAAGRQVGAIACGRSSRNDAGHRTLCISSGIRLRDGNVTPRVALHDKAALRTDDNSRTGVTFPHPRIAKPQANNACGFAIRGNKGTAGDADHRGFGMHILFLTHYFPPEVNAPASRTFEHCSRWVRAGHDVTVITCAPNCPTGVVFPGYRNAWRCEERTAGMRVICVWTWLSANKGFAGRILNYISYLLTAVWCALWLRRVDVVVATSPQFFCGWAGVLGHWIRRWPFVLEIRDIWPESIVAVGAMRRSLT